MSNPKKYKIRSFVIDGRLSSNVSLLTAAIKSFEGKEIQITIERFFNRRSNSQNAYYWSVIVRHWQMIIQEEWGEIWTKEETHEFLKMNLNFKESVDEETGELSLNPVTNEVLRIPKSTAENKTIEAEELHEKARQLAFLMFQAIIPLPEK